jgi:hypothetical protein
VRRPTRRRRYPSAVFRMGCAVVRIFLPYLRVMLTLSRFRHGFLV